MYKKFPKQIKLRGFMMEKKPAPPGVYKTV